MGWFQLDPASLAARVRAEGPGARPTSLLASVARGALGFTAVSVAGFVPWAVFGHALHGSVGELGMYLVCAVIFIGLSGLLLHRLILGAGSLPRFYQLFSLAFVVYASAWIIGWMKLRGPLGADAAGIIGLFVGTALMGIILTRAFEAGRALIPVVTALFVLNTAGYFLGGVVEGAIMSRHELTLLGLSRHGTTTLAMLLWGVCYGLGLGAGLGLAFHLCQAKARSLLTSDS